ncbi:MAG: ParB/RepB/Spo0J family partition protein [Oscillospiraceae bacterium]|nr:ParB/RepB/Spo0J family partition protein [Oscillospiraceae bacterium]
MEKLEYIDVLEIMPHKDNPRKDLGDISELTESIRQNGILQNLTVVKRYGEITGEWNGNYTVIIGHRRLAAARKAGLTEVPCVVAEMTEREQVAAMLSENMQRSDLTVYEQAQGFQMMLDLGATVDQVAEETGFSQTTVRRRVKLLELDREKFKAAESRGATLADYMELDKISDPELKNKVLDTIGTNNFRNALARAIDTEKTRQFLAEREAEVSQWATKLPEGFDRSQYDYVRNYGYWSRDRGCETERPEDADTVQYYYWIGQSQVDIYREKTEWEETEEERENTARKEAEKRREYELKAITQRHYFQRVQFLLDFGAVKSHMPEICRLAAEAIWMSGSDWQYRMDSDVLRILLEIDARENADKEEVFRRAVEEHAGQPEWTLLACAYAIMEPRIRGYYNSEWNGEKLIWEYKHAGNERLDRAYDFLQSIGYEMSDEEQAMRDGTHEVFREERDDGNE